MSNYYDHTLTVTKYNIAELSELVDFITEPEAVPDLEFVFRDAPRLYDDNEITFYASNSINWGIDNADMYKLSRRFPEALFCLWAQDENGNCSETYWKNGKAAYYEPEIIWPDFNPTDLTEVDIHDA